jgi:hypothetical protein
MKCFAITILIFSSTFSLAQTKPSNTVNFNGWRDLSWDNTEIVVKERYGSILTILKEPGKYGKENEYYCPFQINKFLLGIDTFRVSFLFHLNTKKLIQVNVQQEDAIDIRNTVQRIESNLTEKYGKPIIKEETPKYFTKWVFPELVIELQYTDIKVGDVQIDKTIYLSYRPRKADLANF